MDGFSQAASRKYAARKSMDAVFKLRVFIPAKSVLGQDELSVAVRINFEVDRIGIAKFRHVAESRINR